MREWVQSDSRTNQVEEYYNTQMKLAISEEHNVPTRHFVGQFCVLLCFFNVFSVLLDIESGFKKLPLFF